MNRMTILFVLVLCFASVNCKVFSECNGRPSRTFVASFRKNDCRSFVFCDGGNSFEDLCALGLAFDPIKLTCESREYVYCEDGVDTNNNDSKIDQPMILSRERAVKGATKQHPTPPGIASRTTLAGLSNRSTPKRPVPTRKPLTKLTSMVSSPTRKNTPKRSSISPNRPSSGATRRPSTATKLPSSVGTKSPFQVPTPPGAQNVPHQSKPPVSSTLSHDTGSTSLPSERTSPNSPTKSTKSKSKTKGPSTRKTTTTTEYQTESPPSSTVKNENLSDIEEQCRKKTVGSFADPDDCRYYYRCVRGVLNKQECPKGFGWDAKTKMCNSKGCSK